MHKIKSISIALFIGAIAAPLIYAASLHFKGGAPTFSDQGTTLKTCFSLAGLGNGDVTIKVTTTGTATTLCTNQGGNTAPGQNKTPVSPSGQATIPSTEIKNGNLSACVTTTPPPAPTPAHHESAAKTESPPALATPEFPVDSASVGEISKPSIASQNERALSSSTEEIIAKIKSALTHSGSRHTYATFSKLSETVDASNF